MSRATIDNLRHEIAAGQRFMADLRACGRAARSETKRRRSRGVAQDVSARTRWQAAVASTLTREVPVIVLALVILCRKTRNVASVEYDAFAEHVTAVLTDGVLQAQARLVGSSVAGARLVLKIGRAIAEARTALWLLSANAAGAAVSAASLVDKLRESWPAAARTWRSDVLLQRLRLWPQRRKAYAKAFRRRWDVGWRRLPARVDIPAEELLRRVPGGKKKTGCGFQKWGPFLGSKMGTFSLVFVLKRDTEKGLVWGPIFGTTNFMFAGTQFFFLDALVAWSGAATLAAHHGEHRRNSASSSHCSAAGSCAATTSGRNCRQAI